MATSKLEVLFVQSWFSSNLSKVVLTSIKIDSGYEIKRMNKYEEYFMWNKFHEYMIL